MSGYEEEHNIPRSHTQQPPPRRPDMTSFFSALSSAAPSENNPHATPVPSDVTALYRELANSYRVMMGETEGIAPSDFHSASDPSAQSHENELLGQLVQSLMSAAEHPPSRPDGLPDSFFDGLERVPKTRLKADDSCPICSNPFLEDKYPLVVELPCRKGHWFDLECVRPWLSLKRTCPLDRIDLGKKEDERREEIRKKVATEDDEEEWDGMFA
ncbi:MAG: hypothetical protein M1828_000609 [Chrysothrix sp. TS-e1954]|nr:MAG: hypothetical protein M1828_000609 [Chrysothrix sp. TS-e1954]